MNPTSNPNPIIGLDGKPLVASDGKRYAVVGTVNVHASVFELKEGEDMQTAIKQQQKMVRLKDPKLAQQTSSMVFFWAEDDDTREPNRQVLMRQLALYLSHLRPDGTSPMPKDSFELTDEMLGRSEKGSGDETPAA